MNNSTISDDNGRFTVTTGDPLRGGLETTFVGCYTAAEQIAILHTIILDKHNTIQAYCRAASEDKAEIARLQKDHAAMQAIRNKGVYLVPIGFRSDRLWEKVWRGRTIAGYDTDGLAYTDPADCLIAAGAAEKPSHAD